ncbi:hypothetical protein [Sulfurimonas sp.]|uniref:hypothetical protein n=1 Tax=Sulfurimonas sp. TaxID=2022749 RepID=UPI003D146459
MQTKSFLRLYTVVLMGFFIFGVVLSGIFIEYGYFDIHKLLAGIFIFVLLIHLYLRKRKIKKMVLEFWYALHHKKVEQTSKDQFCKNLKNETVEELCKQLNIDFRVLRARLLQRDIVIKSKDHSLEELALYSNYDPFEIASLILAIALHFNKETKCF